MTLLHRHMDCPWAGGRGRTPRVDVVQKAALAVARHPVQPRQPALLDAGQPPEVPIIQGAAAAAVAIGVVATTSVIIVDTAGFGVLRGA
jgi:hypothetical protein